MHGSCLELVVYIRDKYLKNRSSLKILDVGSKNVHSNPEKCLRPIFEAWDYTGLDLVPGKNVDIVSEEPYHYPFPENEFDVVVSANTFEHVQDLHRIAKEIARVSKEFVFIVAPNSHPFHEHPIDCWRIFPSGLEFLLADVAGLTIEESGFGFSKDKKDTYCIAKKYGREI